MANGGGIIGGINKGFQSGRGTIDRLQQGLRGTPVKTGGGLSAGGFRSPGPGRFPIRPPSPRGGGGRF